MGCDGWCCTCMPQHCQILFLNFSGNDYQNDVAWSTLISLGWLILGFRVKTRDCQSSWFNYSLFTKK